MWSDSRSSAEDELHAHSDDRGDKHDPNCALTVGDRDPRRQPGPGRVANRQRQSTEPPHLGLQRKDEKRRNRVDADNEDLVHIDPNQIESQQLIENRHDEKADAGLEESAPEADTDHREMGDGRAADTSLFTRR